MANPAPRLPMGLPLLVRRRTDPVDAVGMIVGFVFGPPPVALVRWRSAPSTFEPLDDLIQVHGIAL